MAIYLDNNATMKPFPEVVFSVIPYLENLYGNPSSTHSKGKSSKELLEQTRQTILSYIGGVDNYKVIFTSGATESNNMILQSIIKDNPEKRHIAISAVEHPSIFNYVKYLENLGFSVSYIKVSKDGFIDLDAITNLDADTTAFLAVMHANNETGNIFPIEKISSICNKKGIHFHCDAVQSFGKNILNVKNASCDSISISAHKFGGLKGIGALILKDNVSINPLLFGGGQEMNFRPGTENTIGILSLKIACEVIMQKSSDMQKYLADIQNYFEKSITEEIPDSIINGKLGNRVYTTSNVFFNGINSHALATFLDSKGICVSTGSACSSSSISPSHVLLAMTNNYDIATSSIRFSFSHETKRNELDKTINILKMAMKELRE